MAVLTTTTELEAVNVMLSNIGESPVNTLDDENVVDAGIAKTILRNVAREVQSEGWFFNTDYNKKFLPNADNRIQLPQNILKVDPTDRHVRYVQRGRFMYDRENHTYDILEAVELNTIIGLEFEDLPETAKRYITLRSARIFQERMLGTPTISQFNAQDEARAYANLRNEEATAADHNMLSDSASVQYTVQRTYFTMR